MASSHFRLNQRALAALDVALRVPCIFIIDAVLNSFSSSEQGPGPGSEAGLDGLEPRGGVLVSAVVLLLSHKALLRFYSLFLAVLLASASVLMNYYAASHSDLGGAVLDSSDSSAQLLPRSGASVWLALASVQLCFGVGFVALLKVRPLLAAVVVLVVEMPLWAMALQLRVDARQLVAVASGLALALTTVFCLAARLRWLYYSCRYVFLLLRHMYRIYGLQLLLEDTWKRIRFPDVLRVFWLSRLTAQALLLLYVLRAVRPHRLWELGSNLIISGCDSTLTVLGMSAVISSIAHYLGLGILAFIGSTEEEDKRLGFVAPVLFFILALQTGLSGLDPDERLVRLSGICALSLRCALSTGDGPVYVSGSASHVSSLRPLPCCGVAALLVALFLSVFCGVTTPPGCSPPAFCIELCLKVLVSLTVYGLFMADGVSSSLWEGLDDYVYYVRSTGSVMEFLFGVVMFANGAYTMMFEVGSKIRAAMMCLHAYFNIYLQARNGWRTFMNRRVGDVCAICYQEFTASARVTPCSHYFHALCLRKWLYIQDTCPMCHQRVHLEEAGPGRGLRSRRPRRRRRSQSARPTSAEPRSTTTTASSTTPTSGGRPPRHRGGGGGVYGPGLRLRPRTLTTPTGGSDFNL
uniref:Ring finger protein 139 n=1 Tax=Neogobius melanostomus TaxID=47308 RepID=A0A8C6S9H5_9GOBI